MLRAMIVDDEAPARSELRFLLEQTGKIGTITEASSVRSAIEMLMESRVDVVFLDISMPGASGLQLAGHCISSRIRRDRIRNRVQRSCGRGV